MRSGSPSASSRQRVEEEPDGEMIDQRANSRRQTTSRRKDQMDDPRQPAPSRQHMHEPPGRERRSADVIAADHELTLQRSQLIEMIQASEP